MDINKILERMNSDSDSFEDAMGVMNSEHLREALQEWFKGTKRHSETVKIILDHGTLNDNEKVFMLVEPGKLIVLFNQFNNMASMTSGELFEKLRGAIE